MTAPQTCTVACQQLVYLARQIQIGLGRDASRATHALASAQPLDADYVAKLQREYPQLQRYAMDMPAYTQGAQGNGGAQLWIIDPHGNLVLRYPPDAEPERVAKEIGRVLKTNQGL